MLHVMICLDNPLTALAAAEAVLGLLEITFVATYTQRSCAGERSS